MKTVIFTMGLPAAGKSTIVQKRFSQLRIIDPDAIKRDLPDWRPYGLPDQVCDDLHRHSKVISNARFHEYLTGDDDFVVDGTGTNFAPLVRKIRMAQEAGFKTRLMYVTCSLNESLMRGAGAGCSGSHHRRESGGD